MATLEQQRIERERAERQRIANAALQNGNTFSGTGEMFSMPSIMNMFGGGGAPMETRPDVIKQMRNQMTDFPMPTTTKFGTPIPEYANKGGSMTPTTTDRKNFSGWFFDSAIGQDPNSIMKDASGDNISIFDYALGDRPINTPQDPRINADVINSIYGAGSGGKDMPGIFQGNEGPVTEPSGFLDKLNAMSGDDIMSGLQGVQGLLDAITPEQVPLQAAPAAKASAGLSLSANPYEDLYKRYGLLGR